jgi:hypothetical protein
MPSGLDALPAPGPATAEVLLTLTAQPGRRALFEEIASQFDIDPALEAATLEPRRAGRRIKKYLPESYRDAFPFGGARTPFAVTDDEYWCAIRDGGKLTTPPVPLSTKTVWGRLLAQALRQPLLARRLSILDIQAVPPPPGTFATGGWLYLTLEVGARTRITWRRETTQDVRGADPGPRRRRAAAVRAGPLPVAAVRRPETLTRSGGGRATTTASPTSSTRPRRRRRIRRG